LDFRVADALMKFHGMQIHAGKHSKPSHIRRNCKSRLILFNPPDNEYLLENSFVHFFGNLEFICSFMEHLKGCCNCVMSEKHEISKLRGCSCKRTLRIDFMVVFW
jgi:hypothetical protein